MALSTEERYLNLALINLGEAVTEIANQRQRGAMPGHDYNAAAEKLRRAISALDGRLYAPEAVREDAPGA